MRKAKHESAASKKIQDIYNVFGGTRKSALVCGYSPELLSMWKRLGRVPLNKVARVSRILKCRPVDLNKKQINTLLAAISEAEERLHGRQSCSL